VSQAEPEEAQIPSLSSKIKSQRGADLFFRPGVLPLWATESRGPTKPVRATLDGNGGFTPLPQRALI
jgi:hypothetical protein